MRWLPYKDNQRNVNKETRTMRLNVLLKHKKKFKRRKRKGSWKHFVISHFSFLNISTQDVHALIDNTTE